MLTKGGLMKGMTNLIIMAFLLAIPIASECKTVAFSPSNTGQPLIFHFNSSFNQMQPAQFSAATWTQLENALLIQSSYSRHIENMSNKNCCAQWDFWADGLGQWQHQNTKDQHQFGFNDITGGLTLGADTYCNNFLVGAAFSYTYSKLRWKQSAGHCQINSYYGGLYGSWDNGCFYVDTALLGAFSNYHTSRHLHFRTREHHAHARHHGWEALAGIETGITLQDLFCSVDLVPFVGVDYVYLAQQGYVEENADRFSLHIKKRNDQLLQSELGIQFLRRIPCEFYAQNWIIAPNLTLSYINQTSLTGRSYHTHFVDRDHEFHVKGWSFDRNLGAIAFGLNFLDFAETMNFTLYYEGQFGKNYWNQTGSLMCNLCF